MKPPHTVKFPRVLDMQTRQKHTDVQVIICTKRQAFIVPHARQDIASIEAGAVQRYFAWPPKQPFNISCLPKVGRQTTVALVKQAVAEHAPHLLADT